MRRTHSDDSSRPAFAKVCSSAFLFVCLSIHPERSSLFLVKGVFLLTVTISFILHRVDEVRSCRMVGYIYYLLCAFNNLLTNEVNDP